MFITKIYFLFFLKDLMDFISNELSLFIRSVKVKKKKKPKTIYTMLSSF